MRQSIKHLASSVLCSLSRWEAAQSPTKRVTHDTCSSLDSKDEAKQPVTLPELTKQLLNAKQKLAEFPDNLKVSFQKNHCSSEKSHSVRAALSQNPFHTERNSDIPWDPVAVLKEN